QYVEELGGHVPIHNEQMKTPVDGLFVAGNITGIESSKVAMAQGELAGLSIVQQMIRDSTSMDEQMRAARNKVNTVRENASIQFHPNIAEGREKKIGRASCRERA